MPIIVFQHSDLGGPGRLGATLRDHGFSLSIRRADLHGACRHRGVPIDLDDVQGVIVLGGPAMVTDIERHEWMRAEAAFIKSAHDAALPVIGICLGAQLIAHALGGKVDWKAKPAVGFEEVSIGVPGQTDTLLAGVPWKHPQLFTCSQEVVQLPAGASLLAGSASTRNAIYRVGIRTFATQFHFECDRPMIDAEFAASGEAATKAGVAHSDLKAQADAAYANYARIGDRLCVNLATYCFPITTRLSA
ncbi:MAG: type 1 glutamine amidotransferase [Phycisphaeraceae bacterium]|nr:type 1 glutamine amidotransferase [Phycisphaeraceae bacterium]